MAKYAFSLLNTDERNSNIQICLFSLAMADSVLYVDSRARADSLDDMDNIGVRCYSICTVV